MWFLPAWSDLFYKFGETKIALFVALSLIYSEINLYNPIMDCIDVCWNWLFHNLRKNLISLEWQNAF
jgi:hypothetical protein